jgi:hypothetical protein
MENFTLIYARVLPIFVPVTRGVALHTFKSCEAFGFNKTYSYKVSILVNIFRAKRRFRECTNLICQALVTGKNLMANQIAPIVKSLHNNTVSQ